MDTDVIIKANGHGIIVMLNNRIPFEELTACVRQKFINAVSYFKKTGSVYVSFQGRKLTEEETAHLFHVINHIPGIDIRFLRKMEHPAESLPKRELMIPPHNVRLLTDKKAAPADDRNLFYEGQLKSGQILEVKRSIIVLGDVWQGAKIISGGNIIIIGSLYGTAIAGKSHDTNRFVLAQNMQPVHIQIGNVRKDFSIRNQKKFHTKDAVMAYCENGQLIFESLSHTSFHDKMYF